MSDSKSSSSKIPSIQIIPKHKIFYQRKQYMSNITLAKWLKITSKKYKDASKVLQYVEEKRVDVSKALFHLNMKIPEAVTDLIETVLYHEDEINFLLNKFDLAAQLEAINKYALKVLITELLWGRQYLSPNECSRLLYYEADILESFVEAAKTFNRLEHSSVPILPVYVRINTLAIRVQDGIDAFLNEGWKLLPKSKNHNDFLKVVASLKDNNFVRDFHISELLVFPSDTLFYSHPGYKSGKFFIQDKGSCLSSFLLNPKPGSRILDMCAAPGLKTNHLANIINNEGIIFACDNHPDRYNALCKLVQTTNVTCVETIYDDCMKLCQSGINYILVDAPSTYSGIFYKREKQIHLTKRLERSFKVSSMMLRYALQSFKGVKRVVYTTCSKFAEETDKVVDDALREVEGAYSLLDPKEMLWNEWGNNAKPIVYPYNNNKSLHIRPKYDLCEGYFIAVFERNPEVPVPRYVNRKEEIFYKDSDDEQDNDNDVDDEPSEEFSGKIKSYPPKKTLPGIEMKDYKSHNYYKPHDKNDGPSGDFAGKSKIFPPKKIFPGPEIKDYKSHSYHKAYDKNERPSDDFAIKIKSFPPKKTFPGPESKDYKQHSYYKPHVKSNGPNDNFTGKIKSFSPKKIFPGHELKNQRPHNYKPYNQNYKNDHHFAPKVKGPPKPRASSSTNYHNYNNYDNEEVVCETTHSQLYP